MKKMTKISVLMITKDAEITIKRSLTSIKNLASEIVIVDGGSSDKTINIAKKFHPKIFYYHGENWGNQCQIGLKKITGDWVLVLDSDEIVTKKLAKEIISLLKGFLIKENGFYINFQSHYLGRPLKYGGENYKKMVFFKNKSALVKAFPVHYYYQIKKGKVGLLKNKILHYSYRSVIQTYKKFTYYARTEAKIKLQNNESVSLRKLFINPIHMFYARFIEDEGYKDGLFRIPLDIGFAYMEFITYFCLLFKI